MNDLRSQLLRAGRTEQAPSGVKRRAVAGAILAGGAVTGKAVAASTALASSGFVSSIFVAGGFTKALVILTVIGSIGAGSVLVATKLQAHSAPAVAPVAFVPTSNPQETRIAPPTTMATESPIPPVIAAVPSSSPATAVRGVARKEGRAGSTDGVVPSAVPLASAPALAVDPLIQEVRLLSQAKQALAAGAPLRALVLIAEYNKTTPNGSLTLEASALQIEALSAAHQEAEAGDALATLERSHPGYAALPRLRKLLSK